MATDLTPEARVGYDGNPNPHLATSPSWYAHALGAYLHGSGRSAPRGVRMSRGNSIWANDMLFRFTEHKGADGLRVTFERVA